VSVADAVETFAAELCRLLGDHASREAMERNAFAAAQKYLALEVVYSPVLRRLETR